MSGLPSGVGVFVLIFSCASTTSKNVIPVMSNLALPFQLEQLGASLVAVALSLLNTALMVLDTFPHEWPSPRGTANPVPESRTDFGNNLGFYLASPCDVLVQTAVMEGQSLIDES